MEIRVEGNLFQKRIFPALDIQRCNTRREELLLEPDELKKVWLMRKVLRELKEGEAMELLIDRLSKSKSNADFLTSMNPAEKG